jgi:hypothetical protein
LAQNILLSLVALTSLVATGCYSGAEGPSGDDAFRGEYVQGISLQGISLQGISLQGISLQGISLQGISLQGISLQGTSFEGFQVENAEQVIRSGMDLIGAEWTIKVSGKNAENQDVVETFVLRFDDIVPDPNYPDDEDMLHYMISYKPKTGVEWAPLCKNDLNEVIPAIPLQNYWNSVTGDRVDDENVISFACTSAVLAKCVEWGYRPWVDTWRCRSYDWKTPEDCDLKSLKDYHQACTRMARADYCGNGTPWTVNGTTIDIYDHLYPQIQEREAPTWQIEAEWGPDGAECLQDIRQQAWKAQGQYPKCTGVDKYRSKPKYDCGTLKWHRAMMVSAFPK